MSLAAIAFVEGPQGASKVSMVRTSLAMCDAVEQPDAPDEGRDGETSRGPRR
jgi:hypothetical protein